jgi:hypothetical protein
MNCLIDGRCCNIFTLRNTRSPTPPDAKLRAAHIDGFSKLFENPLTPRHAPDFVAATPRRHKQGSASEEPHEGF